MIVAVSARTRKYSTVTHQLGLRHDRCSFFHERALCLRTMKIAPPSRHLQAVIKAISLIGRWLAVLAVCVAAKLLPSFWYEFNRMQGNQADEFTCVWLGALAILVVASVETFRSIDSLLDKKSRKMFRHAGGALIAGAMFLYPWWGYDLGNPIERARFAFLRQRYDECAATAQRSYSMYKFNTCEDRFAGAYVHFLVYDTSGQIALPREARSSDFAAYLKNPEYWMYTDCRLAATEFAPHFFYLETFCDTPAE